MKQWLRVQHDLGEVEGNPAWTAKFTGGEIAKIQEGKQYEIRSSTNLGDGKPFEIAKSIS